MKRITGLALVLITILFAKAFAFESDPNLNLINSSGGLDEYPHASYIILYDSSDVSVKESGLSYVRLHRLIKILKNSAAKKLRQLDFNYDPLSADIEIIEAKIYKKDGSVEKISKEKYTDYPAPARMIYWGARKKTIEFGRLEAGDAIETIVRRKGFTYALLADESDDERFAPPMKGHYYDIVNFWTGVPILEKVYRLVLPSSKKLQYQVYHGELESYVHFPPEQNNKVNFRINPYTKEGEDKGHPKDFDMKPGHICYVWRKTDMMPFKGEPNMVSRSDVAPKLLLSTSPDWYAKSIWFNKVNEDFGSFDVTPEVQKKTDELIKGVSDEMKKISILVHWVAEEVRYSGISMGEGEGYTLHKGEMTFSDRCGVCKDKAGMLITMLRAAGFESYAAMTMAGSRIDRIPADQFNHSVTVAKLKSGDWILLDPTWVPGVRELWSSAEQQQQYLPGIPGGSDILTTPISPAENHYWKLSGESTLKSDGTLTGEFTLEAEGQSDAMIRRGFNRSYLSSRKGLIPEIMHNIRPGAEVLDYEYLDPDDLSKPMKITIKYRIPNYALVTDDKIIFTPLLAINPMNRYSSELHINTFQEEKKYGFRARCSKLVEINETITLPRHKSVDNLPEFETVDAAPAKFNAEYKLNGNRLTIGVKHVLEKRLYEAEDWPEFRKALIERKKLQDSQIILVK